MKEREELRDEFAMAALAGMLAEGETRRWEIAARDSYRYADAMLAARDLPGNYEKSAEYFRNEAEEAERLRLRNEAVRKTRAPNRE